MTMYPKRAKRYSCNVEDLRAYNSRRLARVRRQLGLSVNQMAEILGCSERTLRRWQKGTHTMPGQILIRLRELDGGQCND